MKKKLSDLAGFLADQLDADCLIIAVVDDPEYPKWAKTLKVYADGECLENFLYSLEKAPCQRVVESHTCVYPEFVQELFPAYELLKRMDIEGYAGVPLLNGQGNTIGILVALFKNAIQDPGEVGTTLETFSQWASAEVNRIEAERVLSESEALFRASFQLSPDAVVISTLNDSTILGVSDAFVECLGYSRDEVIGKSALDLELWVDPGKRTELVDLIRQEGAVRNMETCFRAKDNTVIPGLASFTTIKFDNTPCLLTTVKDMSELKEAEKALAKSEARYRYLYEKAPVMLHSIDERGRLVSVSDRWLDVMGYDRKEVIGRKSVEFLTLESRRKAEKKILPEFFRTGKVQNVPYRFVKKNGDVIDTILTAQSEYGDEEGIERSLAAITDITDLRRAEEELRESEERFRTVFELNPDVVVITRVDDGIFVDVNDAFSQTTGYGRGEVIGRSILDFDIWPSPEARDECVSIIVENGCINNSESRLIRKDGTIIDGLLSSRTLNLDGELHLLTIVKDVTEQKQAQEKIRKSLNEKKLLLREIHHRVKNNMQVIASLLRLQARQVDDEYVQELFEKSQSRIRSMSLVHEQLYQSEDFAHISFQDYLEKLVNNVAGTYVGDTSQITTIVDAPNLDLSIDSSIPCGLIVSELVSNAYKYAFPSGRHGTVSIKAYKDDDDMINLKIEDNGKGIPKFIDLRKMESLGLKLVYMLAEHQLSGKVEVDRKSGTRFHIRFKDTKFVEGAG
jgi:PAS domain S-box-containing protein